MIFCFKNNLDHNFPRIVYYQPVFGRHNLPPSIQADLDLVRSTEIKPQNNWSFVHPTKKKSIFTPEETLARFEKDKHRHNEKDRRIKEKSSFDGLTNILNLQEKTNKVRFCALKHFK